ncbi:DNA-binding response regulator [Dyella monticola]|uniref:DNA-binding response regulator n=1 Tax=Dyella monticola TaxID=1927958 RepID=A0A370WUJ4_9GAMM|nr:response regulator transcription factor [Dyella monticola]RDS79696.1 DNA-binding response regulator [Dyella monticola]
MRVVIADNHEVVRIGLRSVLQRDGESYEVVGEASNGSELLAVLAYIPCDAAIVDFQMPEDTAGLDGMVLLREVRRRHPRLRVVVLTVLRNAAFLRAMYQEGADAVVEKVAAVQELLFALRTVRAGRTYVSKQIREQLMPPSMSASDASRAERKPVQTLSGREVEVMRLLAQGLTVSEVARTTHRSVKTISLQKHSAMAKLGIANDQQLFDYVRTSGLS